MRIQAEQAQRGVKSSNKVIAEKNQEQIVQQKEDFPDSTGLEAPISSYLAKNINTKQLSMISQFEEEQKE